ncbi:MAG TPA: 16S rRNA (cytosine(967)-C(5))-methyltransferase RsmB [Ignavibacteria bacterium]|nr:16S rRNA (cytosine(967)-C(5))-methyltransferase RsmB [Bacteroidota bacterium]HRI84602.1 16S rRNA (cytosine(967)-C(5))-methyltransferase RsmB [Ignavibacteria bacterium]HRJ98321.1 16S rRNA (cytosine(967)-C(5))-methyltransferase RsmB [Ignavibacteria bacterium]
MDNQKLDSLSGMNRKNGSSSEEKIYSKNLFEDARSCTVKILCRCERTDSYLEKLIDAELKNDLLNDFDKALLNEISHGVIRWMRRLDWFLNGFYRGNYEKCLPEVRNALRVALYQILFLNKIPYSAAVNEAVEFVKRIHGEKHAGVVNGLLRTIIRTLDNLVWPTREIDEVNYLGIVQSHPNWMVRRWINRFGFDEAVKLCEENNRRPVMTLRVNNLKISTDDFENFLKEKNLFYKKGKYLNNFFSAKSMSKLFTEDMFKLGYFSVQDESAGLVSELMNPKKDEIIIDLCAAPGGKASHISELMGNEGKIIAVEKYLSRTEVMKSNMKRLGVKNVTFIHDDICNPESAELKESLIGKADKILVDAPCSGLGVLSKKPDIKWKRESEDIMKLQTLQLEILENAVRYLKDHGVIIYSTCTTETEENADVVDLFLKKNPSFKIEDASEFVDKTVVNQNGCIELFPHINKIDGAFSVRLKRIS